MGSGEEMERARAADLGRVAKDEVPRTKEVLAVLGDGVDLTDKVLGDLIGRPERRMPVETAVGEAGWLVLRALVDREEIRVKTVVGVHGVKFGNRGWRWWPIEVILVENVENNRGNDDDKKGEQDSGHVANRPAKKSMRL
jgi:hypothetical protein